MSSRLSIRSRKPIILTTGGDVNNIVVNSRTCAKLAWFFHKVINAQRGFSTKKRATNTAKRAEKRCDEKINGLLTQKALIIQSDGE
jgi:hypothetical protein